MASILFVDDEPLTRKLLTQAATIMGHVAITAASEEEALRLAADARPDLIVTDVNLHGRRSLEMIRQLHTSPETSSIPIVTLSALNLSEIQSEARESGAVASLEKPIRLQELLEVIGEYAPKK
ncbi:MAG TPA: response regulator [Anaerolineales bacterium]|mgnify:CR=1 FL=1|nr:response regulator [Anaerolineales bacterium]HRQ91579.1 response regulator [Anaerolineales bacterium]